MIIGTVSLAGRAAALLLGRGHAHLPVLLGHHAQRLTQRGAVSLRLHQRGAHAPPPPPPPPPSPRDGWSGRRGSHKPDGDPADRASSAVVRDNSSASSIEVVPTSDATFWKAASMDMPALHADQQKVERVGKGAHDGKNLAALLGGQLVSDRCPARNSPQVSAITMPDALDGGQAEIVESAKTDRPSDSMNSAIGAIRRGEVEGERPALPAHAGLDQLVFRLGSSRSAFCRFSFSTTLHDRASACPCHAARCHVPPAPVPRAICAATPRGGWRDRPDAPVQLVAAHGRRGERVRMVANTSNEGDNAEQIAGVGYPAGKIRAFCSSRLVLEIDHAACHDENANTHPDEAAQKAAASIWPQRVGEHQAHIAGRDHHHDSPGQRGGRRPMIITRRPWPPMTGPGFSLAHQLACAQTAERLPSASARLRRPSWPGSPARWRRSSTPRPACAG